MTAFAKSWWREWRLKEFARAESGRVPGAERFPTSNMENLKRNHALFVNLIGSKVALAQGGRQCVT
jgi:hypothetical protein